MQTAEKGNSASEDCKICVLNFGKHTKIKEMETLLSEMKIKYKSIQKRFNIGFGFIIFETKEERDSALPLLKDISLHGKPLDCKAALPKKGIKPVKRGRGEADNDDDDDDASENPKRRMKQDEKDETVEAKSARDAVTPWHSTPYADQLVAKDKEMRKMMTRMTRMIRKSYVQKKKELQRQSKKASSLSRCAMPKWLGNTAAAYAVVNGKLVCKDHHEVEDEGEWEYLGDGGSMTCLVSYRSELVGYSRESRALFQWNSQRKVWDRLLDTKEVEISAMISIKGELYVANAHKVVKIGSCKITQESPLIDVLDLKEYCDVKLSSVQAITVNNGTFYLLGSELNSDPDSKNLKQVVLSTPVQVDSQADVKFSERFTVARTFEGLSSNVVGMVAHNSNLKFMCVDGSMHKWILKSKHAEYDTLKSYSTVFGNFRDPVESIVAYACHTPLCCYMQQITASPITEGYRNKCEFSVGYDNDGKATVGFRKGLYREGSISIENPRECGNVSLEMKTICDVLQQHIRACSFQVYNRKTHSGVWRTVTVRFSDRTKDLMVLIQVNLSETEQQSPEWRTEKDQLAALMKTNHVTSFFVQNYTGVSAPSEDHPIQHVFGNEFIVENLFDLTFQVSPQSFFQVNTPAAETLYSLVAELATSSSTTTHDQNTTTATTKKKPIIYDVCCGTGTIGLCVAKVAKQVIGVELCTAATRDAKRNAELNNITNAVFYNQRAEAVMKDLLVNKRKEDDDGQEEIIAIVDPPRSGLHMKVLRALRECEALNKIVYVSCNPTGSFVQDAKNLCGPGSKMLLGTPFYPTFAAPVDLFPHTPHCEMVVVFERVQRFCEDNDAK